MAIGKIIRTKLEKGLLMSDKNQCLDTAQLNRLEQSFNEWLSLTPRWDIRLSRQRILIIFILIRYTGGKLNEVLSLKPFEDIDPVKRVIFFRGNLVGMEDGAREVQISESISRKIQALLSDPMFKEALRNDLTVDPGFVRRKFYERAEVCGFSRSSGGPEMIRKARAVELIQDNMPMPAVQMMLGHSTPNLTSAYASFSEAEIRQVTRLFIERESIGRTSARNTFLGKIKIIQQGDIQTRVDLITIDGHIITTVITNDSVERLVLKENTLVTAEVKAPWVFLQSGDVEPHCSAENKFKGVITKITRGKINSEYTVQISDGTRLCSVVSTENCQRLQLKKGDGVWVFFNCFSVVLHAKYSALGA